MKILICEPNKMPVIAEIENEVEAMQAIVGGPIEVVYLESGALAICNEEGRLMGLPGNRRLNNNSILAGTFFICSDSNTGAFKSITQRQLRRYILWQPDQISKEEVENIPAPVILSIDEFGNIIFN